MDRRATLACVTLVAVAAAGVTPALATTDRHRPKNVKGTWSFIDATVDPTPSTMGLVPGTNRDGYCVGNLPAAPSDVNSYKIKVLGPGMLSVAGDNIGDWAMEIRDAKGTFLTGSDGGTPEVKEGAMLTVTKPGIYTVVYCNLGGAPTVKAKYSYKYR